jgi:hypothetical protein
MEVQHINQLKQHVERTLGRKIVSSTDCRYLHNDISQQSQSTLSFNTLRRFFNLMETKHEYSGYTLNVLATYCGFSSFEDFTSSSKRQLVKTESQPNADLINYLVMLFKDTEVTSPNDYTYLRLVRQTIIFLQHHPALIDQFQREIARTENGQNLYFEHFINIDNLNSYYGEGIKYYLHAKKTVESQIFGNYLLSFRSWLTNDQSALGKYHMVILAIEVDKKTPPAYAAYSFAAQIYHAESTGSDRSALLLKIREYYTSLKQVKDSYNFLAVFHVIVSQALLLCGEYEDALFYINDIWKNKKKYVIPTDDKGFLECIHLFEAMAMARMGEKVIARQLLDNINTNNFYFLSRQYMTILYLLVKQFLRKTLYEQKQLTYLANMTGFQRLLTW